ncbi:MAG: bis(5'-nucleosyl)-tetraphosphatase (symmetrical) YqeK [Bacilli bacterium]|nr:bis(5'-nucleosyl)-tetraphosphatase (symmetrical) YqeK [Bacilli bacterium]
MKYSIEELKSVLKSILSEKRYNHSILVMEEAQRYALKYKPGDKEFLERVKRAALMHDVCKEMTREEVIKYVEENNIDLNIDKEENKPLIHGIIGADLCFRKYDFTSEMANAIRWHTTGSLNMSLMDKIVFIADKIGRENLDDDLKKIRNLSYNNLDDGIILFIEKNIVRLKSKGIPIIDLSYKVVDGIKAKKN